MVENEFTDRSRHFVTAKFSRGGTAELLPLKTYNPLYFNFDIAFPPLTVTKPDSRTMHGAPALSLAHPQQASTASIHRLEQLIAADKNCGPEERKISPLSHFEWISIEDSRDWLDLRFLY